MRRNFHVISRCFRVIMRCFRITTRNLHVITSCFHVITKYFHVKTGCFCILTRIFNVVTRCFHIIPRNKGKHEKYLVINENILLHKKLFLLLSDNSFGGVFGVSRLLQFRVFLQQLPSLSQMFYFLFFSHFLSSRSEAELI